MKKLFTSLLTIFLITGISSSAFAQHCDVKKGDSMWIIAKRYHVNFKDVLELNKHFINQNLIHPKDEVELPDGNTGNETTENSTNDNITDGSDTSDERGESTQAQEVLKLVNAERAKQGLKPLTLSSKLTSIANEKAKDMANNNYFSHTSPTYGSPFQMLQKFGVSYKTAGENIAAGQDSAQQVMNDWMNSSGHKANILNANYTELGVGYVNTKSSYGTYWVQLFIGK